MIELTSWNKGEPCEAPVICTSAHCLLKGLLSCTCEDIPCTEKMTSHDPTNQSAFWGIKLPPLLKAPYLLPLTLLVSSQSGDSHTHLRELKGSKGLVNTMPSSRKPTLLFHYVKF